MLTGTLRCAYACSHVVSAHVTSPHHSAASSRCLGRVRVRVRYRCLRRVRVRARYRCLGRVRVRVRYRCLVEARVRVSSP